MLSSINRLKKRNDFDAVFKKGKSVFSKIVGVKKINNCLKINRFGIVVSTKVSKKAVDRNSIKRKIRTIIKEENNKFFQGFDLVVITLPEIKKSDYQNMKKTLNDIFKKQGLYLKNKHN